jgi:phage terminase small subunit
VNDKQRLFVAEYLKDKNAKQAAIRAGYAKKTAETCGPRLLRSAQVKSAVTEGLRKISDKCEVTAERVIAELGRVAFSDLGSLYHSDGTLKGVHEWSEDARRAVAGIESEEIYEGFGQDRQNIGDLRKVKLWSKNHALETLARHFKLLIDRVEVTDVADHAKILKDRRAKLNRAA